MAEVSFGIGGYGEKGRRIVATCNGGKQEVNALAQALREFGFWTVVDTKISEEPTVITFGEVIIQKGL